MRRLAFWVVLGECTLTLASAGCEAATEARPGQTGVVDAGQASVSEDAGRASLDRMADDDEDEDAAFLGLARPEHGFRVRSVGAEVPPGADLELCEVALLPGDPREKLYANGFELANGRNSHHLIVYALERGSPAEEKAKAIGVGKPVECVGIDNVFGRSGVQRIAGSQTPYQSTDMPNGVGRVFDGSQYIVFDYHYLNLEDQAIQARSAISFHVTREENVRHLAREFGMSNYTFSVDPDSSGSVTAECHFDKDITLGGLARHTHRWGADFTAWFVGGERDGKEIWTSHDYENDANHNFDLPVQLKAGAGLRFKCAYENTTDHVLRFGTSATDEMCILFALAWPTQPGETPGKLGCDVVWVDDKGMGHPADEAGGIPAPDAQSVSTCRAFAKDACAQCRCGACAKSMIGCGADSECSAITSCYGACPAGSDCNDACRSTVDQHSSAVGLLTQMTGCFSGKCAQECNQN